MPDEPLVGDLSLKLPHQGDDVRQAERGLDLRKRNEFELPDLDRDNPALTQQRAQSAEARMQILGQLCERNELAIALFEVLGVQKLRAHGGDCARSSALGQVAHS